MTVSSFAPGYYASGGYELAFDLIGDGFDLLPQDAVAVPMSIGGDPLQYRYIQDTGVVMRLVSATTTTASFATGVTASHSASTIGAILSADREKVYWVNETNRRMRL